LTDIFRLLLYVFDITVYLGFYIMMPFNQEKAHQPTIEVTLYRHCPLLIE